MTSNDAIGVTEAAQQSAFADATSLTGSARTPPPQTRRGERETATLWRSRRTPRLGAFATAPSSLEPRAVLAVHQARRVEGEVRVHRSRGVHGVAIPGD